MILKCFSLQCCNNPLLRLCGRGLKAEDIGITLLVIVEQVSNFKKLVFILTSQVRRNITGHCYCEYLLKGKI